MRGCHGEEMIRQSFSGLGMSFFFWGGGAGPMTLDVFFHIMQSTTQADGELHTPEGKHVFSFRRNECIVSFSVLLCGLSSTAVL